MNMNKLITVIVIASVCAAAARARAAAVAVETPNMAFEIDGDASNARFVFPRNTATGRDFWRLILDDGERTEIPVFSHAQKGRVTRDGDALTVSYDRVVSDYGEFYFDGRFTVLDTSPLPPGVVRGEFLNKDGTKLLTVLHNASGKLATVKGVLYLPGNLSFNITSHRPITTKTRQLPQRKHAKFHHAIDSCDMDIICDTVMHLRDGRYGLIEVSLHTRNPTGR